MKLQRRLREGSTWAAIAALAAMFSDSAGMIVPHVGEVAMTIAGAVAAIKAIVTKDDGAPD